MSPSILLAVRRTPISLTRLASRNYAASSSSSSATSSASPSSSPKQAGSSSTSPADAAPISRSSCAPDTVLKGVNYLKGQPPVVAQADDAYPEWLWNVLKLREYEDDGPGGKKERVERRKANRQAIKDRNFMQTQ